mgnify:CR=1 FL=1
MIINNIKLIKLKIKSYVNINMETLYKKNLNILGNLRENENIYYENNEILLDDRYFSIVRYGNNIDKITNIINISFLHYFNVCLLEKQHNQNIKIKELLKNSILGLEKLKSYYNNNNIYSKKIDELIIRFSQYIVDLENNTIKIENETILDEIKLEESKIDVRTENCENTCDKNTCNSFTNIFINTKNNIIGFFISIYNHIFIY